MLREWLGRINPKLLGFCWGLAILLISLNHLGIAWEVEARAGFWTAIMITLYQLGFFRWLLSWGKPPKKQVIELEL